MATSDNNNARDNRILCTSLCICPRSWAAGERDGVRAAWRTITGYRRGLLDYQA
jgi:hypothetical protein